MIILGVDPGSRLAGWGVIAWEGSRVRALEYGVIKADTEAPMANRLASLHQGLAEVIARNQPAAMALESLFFSKNVKSALVLAQARGVLMLAAAQANLPVFEYAPLDIKKASVGYGRAAKDQVQFMMCRLLGISEKLAPDAADALAAAFCHGARFARLEKRLPLR
jgi:crossover junction endodeoxyribonuclease RuvC